jgi:hypothetical protein
MRGKQEIPSKGLGRVSYNGMEDGKGGSVEKEDGRKVRIS